MRAQQSNHFFVGLARGFLVILTSPRGVIEMRSHRSHCGRRELRLTSGKTTFVELLAVCCVVVGCDPVRATSQAVHVRVTYTASGRPVIGGEVLLKYDYE